MVGVESVAPTFPNAAGIVKYGPIMGLQYCYVTEVADCDLHCIEEPLDENLDDYRRLRDHMRKVD